MRRPTACLLALLTGAMAAGRLAAEDPKLATDAVAEDSPRAAFVWSYLCKGRPPHRQGDLLTCPCLDGSGAPSPEEPAQGGANVVSLYLGSFTEPGRRQALVSLGSCGPMNSPAALLLLEEVDGAWRKVSYQAPPEVSVPGPIDLHELSDTCLSWTPPGGTTRLVCINSVAYFGRAFAPSFGLTVLYAVEPAGGEPSYKDLLHLADNTQASCDTMPQRHLARVAAWHLDGGGTNPRLTVKLRTGDKRTTQHGDTPACRADRPAGTDVTLTFAWNSEAWNPTAESAAERQRLETIYQTLAKP